MIQPGTRGQKRDKVWLHFAVMLFFCFGFRYLPPLGPLTDIGMATVGCFLCILYGWNVVGLIWPSLLCIVSLVAGGLVPLASVRTIGFGSDTIVLFIFMLSFCEVFTISGSSNIFANWMCSRKFINGRPWLFSFIVLFSCWLLSGLSAAMAMIFLFWGIMEGVYETFHYKPLDKYPLIMMTGIGIFATAGASLFPFSRMPLILFGMYGPMVGSEGMTVAYIGYIIFISLLSVGSIVGYLAVCKYILHIDVSNMANIDVNEIISAEDTLFSKRHKAYMLSLGILILLFLLPSVLPASWGISAIFSRLTNIGVLWAVLIVMSIVKVDGQPLIDIREAAKGGVQWDMVITTVTVLVLSTVMTNDASGIKEGLQLILQPVLSHLSPMLLIVGIVVSSLILTNLIQNMVVAVLYLPIIATLCTTMDINGWGLVAIIALTSSCAFVLPSGSPIAAIIHSNPWVKPAEVMKFGIVIVVMMMLVMSVVAVLFTNLLITPWQP